jgi:hypothetical protein
MEESNLLHIFAIPLNMKNVGKIYYKNIPWRYLVNNLIAVAVVNTQK